MSDNRGFTLVELLAVIVILSSVAFIAVFGITKSLGKREEKECEEQKELVKNAAKIYFSINGGTEVKIEKLIEEGYFDDESKYSRIKTDGKVFKKTVDPDKGIMIYEDPCKP